MKVNWDAGCDKLHKTIGLGAIVRDREGQVLGSMFIKKCIVTSPFTVEALGLFKAIMFCKHAGFSNLILAGDALQVVELMQTNFVDWSEGICIIIDSKKVFHTFSTWSVHHIPRLCNDAANSLSKLALTTSFDVYMLDNYPDCISNIILLDAS